MTDFRNSYLSIHFLNIWEDEPVNLKYFYWFCAFFLVMALLEFSQDYISAILNENTFRVIDSLSYKLFWPLFIPFSMILVYLLAKARKRFSDITYYAFHALLIPIVALTHLLVFSLLLSAISHFVYQNPWPLDFLITEKLSTRLYLGVSGYIFVAGILFLANRKKIREQSESLERRNHLKKISVKNGRKSILVDTDDIKWISSDGPYLTIHTENKKHVVLNSLKNIITNLPANFKRIHRSTIVNVNRINELKSRGNGDYDVVMDNNFELRLSRNYTNPLKGLLL